MVNELVIDALRAAHLLCFAAGMGTALFFDFRTFRTLHDPIDLTEIENLKRIHIWIWSAFGCMWLTGISLIYIRTAFDLSAFSPKLWMKIAVVVLLTINARFIGTRIIPLLKSNMGRSLMSMPTRDLVVATQLAINSMVCWSLGLLLGSSVVLKSAKWDVLLPFAIVWFLALTVGGQFAIGLMRRKAKSSNAQMPVQELS